MAKWGFWDWVSYGCLGIAALGLAVKAAVDSNPLLFSRLPVFFTNPTWSYVPIILFVFGTIILVMRYGPSIAGGLSSKEKEYLDLTPDYLMGLVRDHTLIQAQKLTEVYVDKWLKVSGKVKNVVPAYRGNIVFIGSRENRDVQAWFKRKWAGRTSVLRVDQIITVVGKIKDVRSYEIVLKDCELLNTEIAENRSM